MRAVWMVAGCFLFCGAPAIAKPLSDYPLRPDGIGPLHIGMTQKEVRAAIGVPSSVNTDVTEGCDTADQDGLELMFEDGKLSRVSLGAYDSKNADSMTVDGIKLDDREDRIITVYTKHLNSVAAHKDNEARGYFFYEMKIRPHKYDDNGRYFSIKTDPENGYMFETDGTKIIEIHAGKFPSVEYIEGCS